MSRKQSLSEVISRNFIYFLIIQIRLINAGINVELDVNGKPLPKAATFHFPEYAYKETSKNEIIYHDLEVKCEQHITCENLEGVDKIACVRRCVSYSCYQDIYAFDELEEGEIDVRLNSFKGCVIQRTGNTNRR
ncbi:uncharacterized protein LOC119668391 [Teleopsis dalmanni]|uniref:uncharacterized protein LOC119668391 n=1 Tax=Teleopsis dalmanni TaxID=139649 RepID=UPI0018CCFC6E|nr:uncharacterized protein LOC119668391 [Teleopsis dalmanni]